MSASHRPRANATSEISGKFSLYRQIAEGLASRPAYLLVFGITTLFLLSGIATSAAAIVRDDVRLGVLGLLSFVVALGAAIWVVSILEHVSQPSPSDQLSTATPEAGRRQRDDLSAAPPVQRPHVEVMTTVRTLHYVGQVGPASDFFNRFLQTLSIAISQRHDLQLRYHSAVQNPYATVMQLLASLPNTDAIMVIPKGLDQRQQDLARLKRALGEHHQARQVVTESIFPRNMKRILQKI